MANDREPRRVRYAAQDPDATQVVGRTGNNPRGTMPVGQTAAGTQPGDTAAMPGLHEAQQEVKQEAYAAQQQAAARRAYSQQAYTQQPYGGDAQNPRYTQVQPQGYGVSNQPQPQVQGYVGPNQYGYVQPQGQMPVQPYAKGYEAPRQVEPVGHGRHLAARFFLALFSWVFRLAAIAISVVVVLDSFTMAAARVELLRATALISSFIPSQLAGLYVIDTPFGGAFRGDFAIVAVVLFLVDWILCRIRVSLR